MTRKRLAKQETKSKVGEVTSRTVDQTAWAHAKRIVDNDTKRLVILSPTEVLALRRRP